MDKKRKILNNQHLTSLVANHEIRITKLENKKKKTIKKRGKGPKVTIADVMQALVQFQNSVDQRFNKLENSVYQRFDKIENRINKLETSVDQRFDKIDQRLNNLSNRVEKIEKEVFKN